MHQEREFVLVAIKVGLLLLGITLGLIKLVLIGSKIGLVFIIVRLGLAN